METNIEETIYWLNKDSRKFLERDYLLPGETPEQRMQDIAEGAEKELGIEGFAKKFLSYLHRGFYSLSTPIWCNAFRLRGLPISCFGSYLEDTLESIAGDKLGEVSMMTKAGGGTSAYFGELRGRGAPINSGGTSTGAVHFMELYDALMTVVSQGNVRRGSFAAYLPIDHPDIEEFLKIRGEGHSIQDMSIGVCISNEWMQAMKDGDKDKRRIWGLVIKKRFETGYPYLFFTDNANDAAPQIYKDTGRKINASNLCLVGETVIEVSRNADGSDSDRVYLDDFCESFDLTKPVYVQSFDGVRKVWSKVTAAAFTGFTTELIEIRSTDTPDRYIECTPNHLVLIDDHGWIEAQDVLSKHNPFFDDGNIHNITVKKIELDEPLPVYDITVPETESFFANGIVVHNCSEIMLSSSADESFVCNLSSLNLENWDEIVETDAIETMIYFLDAVQSEFIRKTEGSKYLTAPRNFAINQRALGLGVLGYHGYFQKNMISLESMEAKFKTGEIFSVMRKRCDKATEELASLFGSAPIYKGSKIKRRNVTTMAIAPTTSSSFILGQVSPSIEPVNSNYFVKDLAKGKFTWKNPHLTKVLKEKGQNNTDVWRDILVHGGSVQHLEFLTREEKDVFKTFGEISQKELVILASIRGKDIDQGQSLNTMVAPKTKPKEVSDLLIFGWEQGIKSFYYQRSANPAQELARSIMNCASCEA